MSAPQIRTEQKTAYHLLWEHYMRTGQRLSGDVTARFLETKSCMQEEPRAEEKSAEMVLFEHYLRTGERLSGDAAQRFLERKFNPYHDPDDGRFTFKPGGGSLAPRTQSQSGRRSGGVSHAGHGGVRLSSHAASRQSGSRGRSTLPGASQSRPGAGPAVRPSEASDPIGAIIWDSQHPAQERPARTVRPRPAERDERPTLRPRLATWPIAGATVTSLNRRDKPREGDPRYGPRGKKRFHRGIDIKAPAGTPVLSASRGQVVSIRPNPSGTFGYRVLIYHGRGVYTQYAHLQPDSVLVRSGENVAAGQRIARVGRTGNVPPLGDSHLHFEVRIGSGAPAVAGGHTGNPLDYLPK